MHERIPGVAGSHQGEPSSNETGPHPEAGRTFAALSGAQLFRSSIESKNLVKRLVSMERGGLVGATVRALNFTAFDTRDQWKAEAARVFDRPTRFTLNAMLVKQATADKLEAHVFVRNEASGGTPPSEYLKPEVAGGPRQQKRFEFLLHSFSPRTRRFYVPGKGIAPQLDASGNIPPAILEKVLSQLGAAEGTAGFDANETETGARRRLRRQRRKGGGGSYFILAERRGRLRPGVIYERIAASGGTGRKGRALRASGVRSVLVPSERAPVYRKRFDPITVAQHIFNRLFPLKLARELNRLGNR